MCREENGKYMVCKEHFPFLHSTNTTDPYAEGILVSDETNKNGRIPANPDNRPVPEADLLCFSGDVQPYDLEIGNAYYRVVGDGTNVYGSWWVDYVPPNLNYVRSQLAIRNIWNGDHGLVTFIPEEVVKGWIGITARQREIVDGINVFLPGGGYQIWIPEGHHPGVYTLSTLVPPGYAHHRIRIPGP